MLLVAAIALALGAASLAGLIGGRAAPSSAMHPQNGARQRLLSLPLQAQGPISASLGADNADYRVSSGARGLRASNPAARLSSSFTSTGVTVSAGAARVGLSLRGIRDGGSLGKLSPVAPHAHANRVTYARGGPNGVSEWYANGPLGLEQGFTLATAPTRGQLSISLALSGNTLPQLSRDAQSVTFMRSGTSALRYSGLSVTDATGRLLPSSLALSGRELSIHVQSAGARFPVTIDPLVQDGAKLAPTGASGSLNRFGWSVALSADGNTALVGAPNDNAFKGAAWVFVRSGSIWTQQGAKLIPRPGDREEGVIGETRNGRFGSSVALSANGNTALIGAVGNAEEEGAAWFFTRSGSTWGQQGEPVSPGLGSGGAEGTPFESAESRFGKSVSLSADGNVALIGAPGAYESEGAGFAFKRSGGKWSADNGLELLPNDEGSGGRSEAGASVALSAEGTTALLGGPTDGPAEVVHQGAAWVFTKTSSTPWTQQGPKLTGAEESGDTPHFGEAVALSADGSTALVGAPRDNGNLGAAFAFVRSGTTWSQQGDKLTVAGESGSGEFGSALALSSDGNTALIGAPGESSNTGSAWLFARSGTTWSQAEQLTSTGAASGALFGHAVALSGDAATALVGDGDEEGAARVFVGNLPGVRPEAAAPIGKTTATLNGEINPNGPAIVECEFEYGTSSAYGSTVPCSSLPGEGSSGVAVSASIAELAPGTTYHFRILAASSAGTNSSEDRTFFTLPEAPTVTTGAAGSVTTSSATLNGTVNPNGGTVGECEFEYGTSPSFGSSVPCSPAPGTGNAPVAVSGSISGLSANMTYYYRLRASNAGGTGFGGEQAFTALNGPPEFGFCVKVAPGEGAYANSGCTKPGGKGVYAWQSTGIAGTTFATHLTSGQIKLTASNKALTVNCSGESGAGEFSGPKTVAALTLTLTGCFTSSGQCSSAGQAAGTLLSNPLEGVLGIEKLGSTPAKDKIALDLFPPAHSGAVVQFKCGAAAQETIRGSVIVPLKSGKMLSQLALKFKASATKQKPEGFAESGQDVLEEQLGTGPFAQVGLSLAATLTSSREVEVNSVA